MQGAIRSSGWATARPYHTSLTASHPTSTTWCSKRCTLSSPKRSRFDFLISTCICGAHLRVTGYAYFRPLYMSCTTENFEEPVSSQPPRGQTAIDLEPSTPLRAANQHSIYANIQYISLRTASCSCGMLIQHCVLHLVSSIFISLARHTLQHGLNGIQYSSCVPENTGD